MIPVKHLAVPWLPRAVDTVNARMLAVATRYTFLRQFEPRTVDEAADPGRYVYFGTCPVGNHADTEASFRVSRGMCRCVGCGIRLSPESLYEMMEGVPEDVAEAEVDDLCGVASSHPALVDRRAARKVAGMAARYYSSLLLAPADGKPKKSKNARKYLEDRKMNDGTIRKYGIGFVPDARKQRSFVHGFAPKKGMSPEEIDRAGLLSEKGNDIFWGRITFPVKDRHGRTVGFTARILPEDDKLGRDGRMPSKYMNTAGKSARAVETVYEKSETLYGLDLAYDAISLSRYVIVVEGPMDFIAMREAGIDNVVATLGTALGRNHLRMLSPIADRIYLLFDNDGKPGRQAVEKAMRSSNRRVKLLACSLPPSTKDAAEFLESRKGFDLLQALRASAKDPLSHLLFTDPEMDNGPEVRKAAAALASHVERHIA